MTPEQTLSRLFVFCQGAILLGCMRGFLEKASLSSLLILGDRKLYTSVMLEEDDSMH